MTDDVIVPEAISNFSKLGAQARWANVSPEERTLITRGAGNASGLKRALATIKEQFTCEAIDLEEYRLKVSEVRNEYANGERERRERLAELRALRKSQKSP